ncbi:ead/Ea22-like family protein [Enterobacter cloacae complex sp. 357B1]|uniref:ead/Ea22-like family protein n=1 Tax=Enterobacter cloacae complex sp. 357B1 TaxID=3395827 RepID=UPI003CFBB6F6
MITEKDNVFYCDCGFSFERGRSGAHTCETGLRKKLAESEAKLAALAAENARLKAAKEIIRHLNVNREEANFCGIDDCYIDEAVVAMITPATDAFLAEVRGQAHKEGAHFVANRMLAAWEAGFIDDTAKNAADIARMILTSTEFMVDAPEGDFDRSFADGVLEDIAVQLRKETAQ